MKGPFGPTDAFATTTQAGQSTGERFAYDKFLVNQKTWSLGNKYFVFNEAGQPLFFVDRPVWKLKSNLNIYTDESKSVQLLTLRQDSMFAINFIYTLLDQQGQVVVQFRRHGWMSMIRRTWEVLDPAGNIIAGAQEDSLWKAILRRLPEIGIIGHLFRTNFIVTRPDGQLLGQFIRKYSIADKHVLDLTQDPSRTLDRRVAVGLAVLLDNIERHR